LEAILQTLDRQIDVHRALLTLSRQKRDAIVHNRIDELNRITGNENKLIKLAEELEAARIEAVNAYMRSKQLYVTAAITVSTLIRFVVRLEDKEALTQRQQELVRLIEELRRENDLNRQLIEQSLDFIQYSLDLLVVTDDQEAVYRNPSQSVSSAARSALFDTKA
jgi:flagellar biosynthesis/type III secretory pathway chaperone